MATKQKQRVKSNRNMLFIYLSTLLLLLSSSHSDAFMSRGWKISGGSRPSNSLDAQDASSTSLRLSDQQGTWPTTFANQADYLKFLDSISALPSGFSVGCARFMFKPFEVDKTLPMNLTLIMTEKPTTSFAAMFTSNKFPGGPVLVGKERMKNSKTLQAIVVNNKISNVCPGGVADRGAGDSDSLCQSVANTLKLGSKDSVFPSSTGIIGWRLPVKSIEEGIPLAAANMQSKSVLPAALGITTTDRYPKIRAARPVGKMWSIVGIAKGAGMIEPNLATMLAYIMTDLDLPKDVLEKHLKAAVPVSFNTISVDGDQSTSDTVLVISSQKVKPSAGDEQLFMEELKRVCAELAEDIVRNGEGTQHVIKCKVSGAPSDIFARDLGRFVVNSNLVKCAIAGCDPNVGRIVGAIGSFLGNYVEDSDKYTKDLRVTLGGTVIFEKGAFQLDPQKEKILSDLMVDAQLFPSEVKEEDRNYPMHFKNVDIGIELLGTAGPGKCVVIGSDLTKEYVEVNADYRS